MAEKLTDAQVADLLTTLRSESSLDAKVQFVTTIKSGIKQHNVPETCVPHLFDGLRTASSSQHAALVNAGFTALSHLLTRLSRQDPKLLAREASRTLPLVIEKLGDTKDKYRSLASASLTTLYGVAAADVERCLRTSALTGKNPRAKEAGMHWLLQTHQELGLPFRSYVPVLMELLEDADGMVRDTAKGTVIELFRTAPNTAKSDLKRQLKNFKVRPAIEQAIVRALAPAVGRPETPSDGLASQPPEHPQPRRTNFAASVPAPSTERPMTPVPDAQADLVDPQYVNTNRELDEIFKDMAWFFDGKESEQNWMKRERSINTLRRLNAGNAATDFQDVFVSGLRSMLDGIIKAITSLRTSLSKEGCGLIQEIAVSLGPAMDPMVELLMQTLVKLSAGTKKISSQMANFTVDRIISRVTYNQRLMQHIWNASQDKNVQPRTYATGWLKTIIRKEAAHKSHVEHTGGVDLMEKIIRKGLGDANPTVREKTRSAFWAFWVAWPSRADRIMADLDATAQKLLNKDPSNPNSPQKTDVPAARPGLGLSRSTMASSKPSLREAVMAQKKALAAKNIPARPGSAMAHISSPVRTVSNSSAHASNSTKSSMTRIRPEGAQAGNAGGMSVAPMRPSRRRPDMAARPATAGPYSVRDQQGIEVGSPESIRSRHATPRQPKAVTPKKSVPKIRPGHATHSSESSISSTAFRQSASRSAVPRGSPALSTQAHTTPPSARRANSIDEVEERFTPRPDNFDLPNSDEQDDNSHEPSGNAQELDGISAEDGPGSQSESSSRSLKVYEDPFTEEAPAPNEKPGFNVPVLEDKPVNEDAGNLPSATNHFTSVDQPDSPDKTRQNSKLLDSGITKIKNRNLEVHGFRKLQSLVRDNKTFFNDEKFEALLLGLFQYLEDPMPNLSGDKAQDIKAQILTTIKLLLKRERDNFQPHVSRGLESLLKARSTYDTRAHVVSGLEMLADELVALGDESEIIAVLTQRLQPCTDTSVEGSRILSMGLHVLKEMLEKRPDFLPAEGDLAQLTDLSRQCLESADSGVRMDSVKFCVALHDRVGETAFWQAMEGINEDPKSLITYYIVKKQRERGLVV